MQLPITEANLLDWFPAPHTENPLAGHPWWQLQCAGLLTALQYQRLLPDDAYRQQALVELRRSLDTALLAIPTPSDEEIQRRRAQTLAPWCPSPYPAVDAMLSLADLRPGEALLDLGSGDGRIVIAAARCGARARGIEIDAVMAAEAQERATEDATTAGLTTFQHGTIEDTDWGTPDVVTCYLVSTAMAALAPKFSQLRAGTRIVSLAFRIPGWEPQRVAYSGETPIYLWVVGA